MPHARRTSARGEQRRRLLVETAGALLVEEGFTAVTYRALAQRAGLPLATTQYYFASRPALLGAAVRQVADGWLAAGRAVVAALPERLEDLDALAGALVDVTAVGTAGDTAQLLSLYERYLEAGRHPALRPVVAEYDAQVEALLADVLARGAGSASVPPGLVLAVVDGALLRALAEGGDLAEAVAAVRRLLELHAG